MPTVTTKMMNPKQPKDRILKIVRFSVVCVFIAFLPYMWNQYGLLGILVGFLLFLSFGGNFILMAVFASDKSESSGKLGGPSTGKSTKD